MGNGGKGADWFSGVLAAGSTNAQEIDDLMAAPIGGNETGWLTDDPTVYLMDWFAADLQHALQTSAVDSDLLHYRGAALCVRRDAEGNIEQVLEICTPAGNRWVTPVPDDLISQGEAAKLFNITGQAVNNALRDGRLTGYTKAGGVAHRPGDRRVSLAEARNLWGGE